VEKDKGIIGQMRVAAIEMGGRIWWLNLFVDFVVVFYEEKKRIENRIEERKKSGWVDREGERKKRSMRAISPPLDMMNPPALTPVTLPLDPGHRCFFALARTRASNTTLTIMLCAV